MSFKFKRFTVIALVVVLTFIIFIYYFNLTKDNIENKYAPYDYGCQNGSCIMIRIFVQQDTDDCNNCIVNILMGKFITPTFTLSVSGESDIANSILNNSSSILLAVVVLSYHQLRL